MSAAPPPGANLISCSAKELREIREYIRTLERDLQAARSTVARQKQARSLRFARALREVRRRPLGVLAECWRIVSEPRGRRAASQPAAEHRSFPALDRRAQPVVAAMAGNAHRTVLAEIAERCSEAAIVTLRGSNIQALSLAGGTGTWYDVGPHDFELRLRGVQRPTLLVDPRAIAKSSQWFGLFGIDDMRLNLAMANLVELVHEQRGKVVFARTDAALAPPLLADFQRDALVVDSLVDFDPDARQE